MKTVRLAPGDTWGQGRIDVGLSVLALGVMWVGAQSTWAADRDLSYLALMLLVAAAWVPLLVRHRWPLAVLAATLLVECVWLVVVPLEPPVQFNSAPAAVMLAAWEVGRRHHWRLAWGAAAVAAQAVLVVGEVARGDQVLAANVFALDLVLAAAGAGVLLRSRHHRLRAMERRALAAEQDREAEAQRRVRLERFRMARELHDVVAHHLTLVNAQAGVAGYLLRTDTDAAEQALAGIADNTRQALDELRATVGLLRQYDAEPSGEVGGDASLDPMPGLETLPTLVQSHRTAGTEVRLEVRGDPLTMPSVSDLAAYRVVQEALTNARKHAPGAEVEVRLTWSERALDVLVTNGVPPGGPVAPGPGTRLGLVGMHERADAVGGTLEATPTPDGGWVVHATIPSTSGDEPDHDHADHQDSDPRENDEP